MAAEELNNYGTLHDIVFALIAICLWFSSVMTLPPGDNWRCLETFLVFTSGEGVLLDISWAEARDAATHSIMHRAPLNPPQ